ncbi:MAG: hypothetical protein ACHQFX_05925 [Chitinophagales bacterium]
MRYAITLFVFFQISWSAGLSQQPEQALNQWAANIPIEKVYLHFDRNDYIAGQTMWFKGYVYSDFLPATRSTNLFVEFFNSSSLLVSRQVLPLFGGFAHGQIELPDTLRGGPYVVRAYTATMLNMNAEVLYKKTFFIFSKNKKNDPVTGPAAAARIEFFPEGGNFVTGLSNSIAYKATNENGFPVDISGIVKNDRGDKVAEFSSYHDGMGYFDLVAEENNNYFAMLNGDPSEKKYYLPAQTPKGIVFRVISGGITKSYEILQHNNDPVFKASYMIGQMQHHVVFKKTFKEDKDDLTGIIPAEKLSSGILHITVFNKAGQPLAERLTFVDNKEYIQQGDILLDTLDFSARKKNHLTLSMKDTVQGSFSVSVSDPAFDLSSSRDDNIYSGLLLTGDLNGYIHKPSYYFSATNDSVQNALDLVMMTNGWRRFKWTSLEKDPAIARKYADPGYINLSGKINLESTKKPFADKDLLMFIVSSFGRNIQMVHTDSIGHFSFDSVVFYGNSRILFTDIKGKKSKFIEVRLDGDSLHRHYMLPKIFPNNNYPAAVVSDREKKMLDEYNAIMNAEGLILEGVTVKGRKKTALEETEEKYVSGLFAGNANSTLDLTKEDLIGYRDIFDYLKMRVPGLQILTDPSEPGYIVRYRQTASASAMGEIPMTIFLNEVPSDADAIATIPAHEIALVKVYSTFVGASGNGAGGVLSIYTKKDSDLGSLPSSGDMSEYRGYSIIKEFYSPDHSVVKNNKADNRITLLWNPAILVDDINPKIPVTFYNNDRTKQFKIVIEGMTADGKLLMIERTIGGKKAF